jgi:hypothetical protein
VTIAQRNYQNLHSLARTKARFTDIIALSFVGLVSMGFVLAVARN